MSAEDNRTLVAGIGLAVIFAGGILWTTWRRDHPPAESPPAAIAALTPDATSDAIWEEPDLYTPGEGPAADVARLVALVRQLQAELDAIEDGGGSSIVSLLIAVIITLGAATPAGGLFYQLILRPRRLRREAARAGGDQGHEVHD